MRAAVAGNAVSRTIVNRNKARKARREAKRKFILLSAMTLLFVFAIGLTFGSFLSKAKEDTVNHDVCKYYASIEIQPGDTLWNLADEYIDDNYDSKSAYIEEVLSINSIDSEDHIVAGQYVILPYYVSLT